MKQIRLFCLLTLGFFGFSGMALAHVDPTLPCYATVDADLNVIIPCLEVNGGFHSAVLERIQNPLIGGKLEWQLKSYTEGGGLTLGTANELGGCSGGFTVGSGDYCSGLLGQCKGAKYITCNGKEYCGAGESTAIQVGWQCIFNY